MELQVVLRKVARTLATVLVLGLFEVAFSASPSIAATPIKPTIASITSGATSLTANMVTADIDATSWRWAISTKSGTGCTNPYGEGVVQATGSLSPTIVASGLTAGCSYSFKVAGFNGVVGEYVDGEKLVGAFSNGLNLYVKNEAGVSADSTHLPFTTGTCGSGIVSNIDIDYGSTSPSGCNADGFTSYYIGYIKAPYTGSVTFRNSSDDGFYLNIQGQNVISWSTEGAATTYNSSGSINMVANEIYRIEVWHHEYTGGAVARLYWDWSGQATTIVPSANLATDPSVFFGTCPLGVAARCSAGSAYEIKLATGINMDGQYWIDVNGTPTLVYCIMNSVMSGGGWMLAMKGKKTSVTFKYTSNYWTNTTTLSDTYPQRWKNGDTVSNLIRDTDSKYSVFGFLKINQILALFPEQTTYAGGAIPAGTTGNTSAAYGFSWLETTTAGRVWTSADGDSYNVNLSSGGGPNGSSCVNTATTLTNLFTNSNRCAFRKVSATYSASESPYSAIGNGLFFSQSYIRFFGINYGSSNSANMALARFGFGWNENTTTSEGSNDGSGGIGLTFNGNVSTGSANGCCATQVGISGGTNGSATNIPFEMFIRNSAAASINLSNLRVTSRNSNSMVDGSAPTTSGTNGSNTFRLSPKRDGISIDSTTGVVTVAQDLSVGTYSQTISVVDSDGVSAAKTFTVEVVSDSGETDTALSFDGSSQYLVTTGTVSITGAQTWELWVKASSNCSGATNQLALASTSVNIFCKSYYWYASVRNAAGSWIEVKLSQNVIVGEWAHLALVYDGSQVRFYYNKAQLLKYADNSLSWSSVGIYAASSTIMFGGTGSAGSYFAGSVDEVKIWNATRTQSQVFAGAHTRENLGNGNLLHYWDFNEGSGSAISRGQSSDSSFNITPASAQWVAIAQNSTYGPYTVVTFPRTIITAYGGWKTPDSVTAVSALIVGGGGGGGWNTGGGGGGGAIIPVNKISASGYKSVVVGTGGEGALSTSATSIPTLYAETGSASSFDAYTAQGGNRGATYVADRTSYGGAGITDSSGSTTTTSGTGGNGPAATGNGSQGSSSTYSSSITGSAVSYGSGGGGGAYSGLGGAGGDGAGNGGGTGGYPTGTVASTGFSGAPNRGGGGGGSAGHVAAGNGGSGVVIIRWITALKPSFTQPSNTTIDVGQFETFSVNVAADSATAILTRTFRWESSTTGSNGTFSLIKQGVGASNASFSWKPSDTSTSGSDYLYRVIVTDSDTAGLFIVETSTAVYATINSAMVVSGNFTFSKTINVAKSETFTITLGTPTYRPTISQLNPGISIDTSTSGAAVIKLSETMSVGTYFETLTVTDSVSASVFTPLTINVVSPVSLTQYGNQIDTSTVLNVDFGNSNTYPRTGTHFNDISGRKLVGSLNYTFPTSATYLDGSTGTGTNLSGTTCTTPTFNTDYVGVFDFDGVANCGYIQNTGLFSRYTVQSWVKRNGAQSAWTSFISTPYYRGNDQINISLFWMTSTALTAGIFNGSTWYTTPAIEVSDQTWTFATATFDGSTLRLTTNANAAAASSVSVSVTWNNAKISPNILLGRKWDTSNFFKGSIATVRIYDRVLSDAEVLINYNATKARFDSTNLTQVKPTQKYGVLTLESFTATSGGDTKTVTFANGNRQGVIWDTTSTPGQIKLSVGESLTVGNYYDTVTVTDNFGASTYLPISFTVTKADTITVSSGPSLTTVYTGSAPTNGPVARITGLVGVDTATVKTAFSVPCALGGSCSIGDLGPGGGRIFYISPTVINAASGVSDGGIYLEVAPRNWNGNESSESSSSFATKLDSVAGTSSAIGTGAENTRLLRNALGDSATAATLAMNRTFKGLSDWFVPSYNELTTAITTLAPLGLGEFTTYRNLWSSTQNPANSNQGYNAWSSNPPVLNTLTKTDNYFLRPIRAFSPLYPTETSTPINVETYTAIGSDITFQIGSLSNYQAVIYETSTLKITQANQNKLSINLYGAVAGTPFLIQTLGGSGSGDITETVTAGGSALNCTVSNHMLSNSSPNTEQVSCNIKVTKAASRNYLVESITATVYFMLFVNSMPTNQEGSGATIALNGVTSVWIDPGATPTITGPTSGNFNQSGLITITGSGFSLGPITVRFNRNQLVTGITAGSDTSMTIQIPAGALTGYFSVTNANGTAVSPNSINILPAANI